MKVLLLSLMLLAQLQPRDGAKCPTVKGVVVFVFSLPSRPYIYLGSITIEHGLTLPSVIIPRVIADATVKYKGCDGLIFDVDFTKADCIKFK